MSRFLSTAVIVMVLLVVGCQPSLPPVPKPMGFPRMELPDTTTYVVFNNATCPFTFEYPAYGEISRDQSDSCWVDIFFKPYGCKWHISYKDKALSGKSRSVRFEDYRRLVYKHSRKATEIKESKIEAPIGYGTAFEIYGQVGTPMDFFIGDDDKVVMNSFYYNTALKNDSLEPLTAYMKGQMKHMIQSLKWK